MSYFASVSPQVRVTPSCCSVGYSSSQLVCERNAIVVIRPARIPFALAAGNREAAVLALILSKNNDYVPAAQPSLDSSGPI